MKIIKTSLTSIILSCLSVLVTADGGSYLVRASITVLTAADRPTVRLRRSESEIDKLAYTR